MFSPHFQVFVHRFAHMFSSFEHFVISHGSEDDDSAALMSTMIPNLESSRSQHNFDKTSFLSGKVGTLICLLKNMG